MKKEIASKLGELRDYYADLKDYRRYSSEEIKKDKTIRRAIERTLEVSLECVLNIGEMVISSKKLRKPESYREVIEILGEEGVLPKAFAERFAPSAGFRNVLVHMYSEINVEDMHSFLQNNIEDFNEYAKYIAKYLEKKDSK